MSNETAEHAPPDYRRWLRGPLILIAALIVVRFVLEALMVSKDITRYFSASVVGGMVIIYLGAVAPLRGIRKAKQLVLPALVFEAWAGVWSALALTIAGVFRLPGSHFADAPGPFQNWQHLAQHILFGHLAGSVLLGFPITLGVMSLMFALRRWPIIVAPSAVLGGLVILRFAAEAMDFAPTTAAAWSSTVGALLCALYVGGTARSSGFASARQLVAPSLVLGLMWRFWVFLAGLLSAAPLYHTHFFDRSQGPLGIHLLRFFALQVIAGIAAGMIVWGIASWAFYALRPGTSHQTAKVIS